MNGSGTQPREAVVPPPFAEEQDPLLEFSNESAAPAAVTSPDESPAQPIAAPIDPPPSAPPSVVSDALVARVERLEQALNESKTQVATLTSEVATLVRAIGDIRKQSSRPPVTPVVRRYVRPSWAASAIVAAVIGFGAAIFGWTYLSGDRDTSITASAAAPPVVADSPSTNPAPTANEPRPPASTARAALDAPAPRVTEAPAPKAPRAPQAIKYVGTLSIDADPGGDVFLDRKRVGRTPLRLANLRAGSHLIWIERDGYRRFTRVVNVPADRVTRLSADLEPIVTR